jgi:sulfatase modifying factor 1
MVSTRATRRNALGLGTVTLAASIYVGCSRSDGASGSGDRDAGTADSPASPNSGSEDDAESADEAADSSSDTDSGSSGPPDSSSTLASCAPGGAGMTNCGSGSETCCASLGVAGGTYDRTYTGSGTGVTGAADPATVSGFRLDEYEVTVGRFRRFVGAWNGGGGYVPPAGSGKHTHLNGGQGLEDSSGEGGPYETGWMSFDDVHIAPTDANLACETQFATWTASAGSGESLPINCVNWWEAYAFCIWDGGFLPSEAEWEYAAAGGSRQQQYPWGTSDPGTTNEYAIYGCYYPSGSDACTGGAAPVGTTTLGAGRWGQLDLAGNVNEWTLDWYASYAGSCTDCAYLTGASYRVMRGGYFYNYPSYLLPSGRSDDPPTVRSICIGFRCARSP